jgi:hypothetical protein
VLVEVLELQKAHPYQAEMAVVVAHPTVTLELMEQ